MPIKTTSGTLATTGDKVTLGLSGDPFVLVAISGTYTVLNIIFEASMDGVTWFTVPGERTDTGLTDYGTIAPSNSTTRGWYLTTGPFASMRVRATAISTGSVSVSMFQTKATLPIANVTAQEYIAPNVGRSNVAVAAGSSGANSVLVASGPGILHTITVNIAGATAGMIVYDNATTNSGVILYSSPATHPLGQYSINNLFLNGITVRKASTTAAATFAYTLFG